MNATIISMNLSVSFRTACRPRGAGDDQRPDTRPEEAPGCRRSRKKILAKPGASTHPPGLPISNFLSIGQEVEAAAQAEIIERRYPETFCEPLLKRSLVGKPEFAEVWIKESDVLRHP